MKCQTIRQFLRSSSVALLLSTLLAGCSDRSPVSAAPSVPTRDAAPLPMPANAVTATLDSFPPSLPGYLLQTSTTTPRIDAWGFYHSYGYFEPGRDALVSSGVDVRITFGKPASRVRVIGNSPYGFEMKCPTRTGEILSGRMPGTWPDWLQTTAIDLSGPGIVACYFVGFTVIESITVVPEGQQATLVLRCQGDLGAGRVTRDSTLRCEARKEPSSAPDSLQILAWSFENRSRTDGDLHSAEWNGTMVREGTVTVRAQLGSQAVTKTAGINVEPRMGWPDLQITRVEHKIQVDPVSMADYPPNGAAFGRHQLGGLDLDSVQVDSVLQGPNTGYFYVKAAVRMLPSKIFVHPALYGGGLLPSTLSPATPGYSDWLAWFNDQNGHGSGSCQAAGVDRFRQNIERHEGITLATNSHVGVSNQYFRDDHTQRRLEKVVSDVNVGDLKYRLAVLFDRLTDSHSTYASKQATFDTNDTPNVYNIGCTLDNNRSDP